MYTKYVSQTLYTVIYFKYHNSIDYHKKKL